MATREYSFIVGPETSTLPTTGTPSTSTDLITMGYADENYMQGGSGVADITALKAVSAANRSDKDVRFVESTNTLYRFDSGSAASGDDNLVVTPTAGTGRWLILARNPMENSLSANDAATGANATLTAVATNVVRLTSGTLTSIDMVPASTVTSFFLLQNKTGVDISINNETGGTAANRILTGTGAALTVSVNSSVILLYDITSARWNVVGGSGGGSSGTTGNYFSSAIEFGNSVTGWTAYADAAATTPVDMTGGAPTGNLTFALSTSSPLSGSSNILLSKTAANLQGEGWAYTITPNIADRGKVVSLSFNYAVSSGTYASDDIFITAYDVTNSALIQLSPRSILTHSLTSDRWFGELQIPYTCASLRIGFHCSSTSASAYALKIDNLVLSDSNYGKWYGSAVTDWISFTPTGSWVTNTTYSGLWRRVGDTLEVAYNLLLGGAPTAAALTVNLPTGLSIDSAKIAGSVNGSVVFPSGGIARDNGASDYPIRAGYNTSTSLAIYVDNASSTYGSNNQVSNTVPVTFGSPDNVWVSVSNIPIVGWSSSQLMSDSADTRVIAARYTGTTTVAPASITPSIIPLVTKVIDTHGAYNTSSGLYTVPVDGAYEITFQTHTTVAASAISNSFDIAIYKNGSSIASKYETAYTTTNVEHAPTITASASCRAGDTLAAYIGQNLSAGTLTLSNSIRTYLDIKRVSGPAQIRASELVCLKYTNTAGTTLSGAIAVMPFATKSYDSHLAWNGSRFTCPASGKYSVTASIVLNSVTMTTGQNTGILVYKNGALEHYLNIVYGNGGALNYSIGGSCEVSLVAGDYIEIHAYSGGTTPSLNTTAGINYVCISRIGI